LLRYPRLLLLRYSGLLLLGNSGLLLGNSWLLLGNSCLLLGNPRLLLGNPRLLLGNPRLLLGNPRLLLGNSRLLLRNSCLSLLSLLISKPTESIQTRDSIPNNAELLLRESTLPCRLLSCSLGILLGQSGVLYILLRESWILSKLLLGKLRYSGVLSSLLSKARLLLLLGNSGLLLLGNPRLLLLGKVGKAGLLLWGRPSLLGIELILEGGVESSRLLSGSHSSSQTSSS